MKALLNIPARQPSTAAPAKAAPTEGKMSVTTIRFKPATLAALKKAAIDRDQSLQEMVEQALAELLERDGVRIAGLRRA